jgi:hypothetical protein
LERIKVTIKDKIGQALAAIETVRKSLDAVALDHAEADAVRDVLGARRAELAGVEGQLARAQEEFATTDAAHSDWRQKAAKEQSATNSRIDEAHEKLRVLDEQVKEAEGRHANIIAGIAALSQRLKV